MRKVISRLASTLTAAMACAAPAYAHHAFSANFDVDKLVEVEGQITALHWQNPHVLMTQTTEPPGFLGRFRSRSCSNVRG